MLITIYQEITDWSKAPIPVHNGIYHLNESGHLVAFENTFGLKRFTVPKKLFSKARRKFKKIGEYDESKAGEIFFNDGNGTLHTDCVVQPCAVGIESSSPRDINSI